MFDRYPDAQLVVDLVAVQAGPQPSTAAAAASTLVEEAVAWQRVAAWVEAQRLDTMRRFELARIRADRDLVTEWWAANGSAEPALPTEPGHRAAVLRLEADCDEQSGRFATEELALALNMSPPATARQLSLARDLHDVHAQLGEALSLGQVSGFVAAMVAQATRQLPDGTRRLLDAPVTDDATELTAGRAIDAARSRVAELDTDTEDAAERAYRCRHAFTKPLDDGMAMLSAIMPAEDATRAWRHLDDESRALRRGGDPRNLDQLRCDTMASLLSGTSPAARTAGGPSGAPTASVSVVISLASLLGLDSRNGTLDGYGAISPGVARRILASNDTTLTRLLCDPATGAVVSTDPHTYRPGPGLAHAVICRDRHCRMPVCDAKIRHLDHILARVDAGLTTEDNLQGLCERSHLGKHHPGWHVDGDGTDIVYWTTPTGRTYESRPPPATGYGTGPPPLHPSAA